MSDEEKNLYCPVCFGIVKQVPAFDRDSKKFVNIKNWKYCSKCKGYILTKDCLKSKEAIK